MWSNAFKANLLQQIFNNSLMGSTLYAVLHKDYPGLAGNPTTSVADYTSYAAVSLAANDASRFTISGGELRLTTAITFPANTGANQTLKWWSICTGTTSGDNIVASFPIRAEAVEFHQKGNGTFAAFDRGGSHGYNMNDNMLYMKRADMKDDTTLGSGTNYYVSADSFAATSFRVSTTPSGAGISANASERRYRWQRFTPITLAAGQALKVPAYSASSEFIMRIF